MSADFDDEGCDGRLWRQLAGEERIDDDDTDDDTDGEGLDDDNPDGPIWRDLGVPVERIEGEINDELRGCAALGLTPLQWLGVFARRWDYIAAPPLYWYGGIQRLEELAALRGWILEQAPDDLTTAGAWAIVGGEAEPTIYDAIRWEAAWASLRHDRLTAEGGSTVERRTFFDGLGAIDPPAAAFTAFCDLLGVWSAEVWTAYQSRHPADRPNGPRLKTWLARTDAAILIAELVRVQPGHAEGRTSSWRAWGPFIGDLWAIKEGLFWSGPVSKGGE